MFKGVLGGSRGFLENFKSVFGGSSACHGVLVSFQTASKGFKERSMGFQRFQVRFGAFGVSRDLEGLRERFWNFQETSGAF